MSCHFGNVESADCLGNLITVLDGLFNYSSMNKVTILVRIS